MARYILLTIIVFIGVVFLSFALKGFLRRISGASRGQDKKRAK